MYLNMVLKKHMGKSVSPIRAFTNTYFKTENPLGI